MKRTTTSTALAAGLALLAQSAAAEGNLNQVDGLSGATLTSRGVDNLVKFWVGDMAFGKLLTQLKGQGA